MQYNFYYYPFKIKNSSHDIKRETISSHVIETEQFYGFRFLF